MRSLLVDEVALLLRETRWRSSTRRSMRLRSSAREVRLDLQTVALGVMSRRTPASSARSSAERLHLAAHLRQHGAEQHGGPDRLQRVLGPDQERGRGMVSHALK